MRAVLSPERLNHSNFSPSAAALALLLLLLPSSLEAAQNRAGAAATKLGKVQQLIDSGNYDQALEAVDAVIAKEKKSGEAQLMRSTVLFLSGENQAGELALREALRLSPGLRQGWLTLGGLEMANERYSEAQEAFEQARKLDPQASDNFLNLGVALLLDGKVPDADRLFNQYIEKSDAPGEAHYLISANYAMAGYKSRSIDHLERAVMRDERLRLNARTDGNFAELAEDPRYQSLLLADVYRLPRGHYQAAHAFETSYEVQEGKLLGAVVDALRRMKVSFSPRIEVTPSWSLIWGDYRIKVAAGEQKKGVVIVTAPAGQLSKQQWQERSTALFNQIAWELAPKIPDSAFQ